MNLTLEQLGEEYEHSIKIQKDVIRANRKKLLQAQKDGNYREMKRLSTLLQVLYDEKSELEEKANKLKHYYS
ncbi:MAG: hypothetical protein IKV21_01890 [Clostridia bacterium]|nr:hypothetical protein [Clostridia bacterium]